MQFGARPILDYLTHQRRLFPALAATYAYHLSMQRLKKVTLKVGGWLAGWLAGWEWGGAAALCHEASTSPGLSAATFERLGRVSRQESVE